MISQELIDVVYPVDEVSECYVGTQENHIFGDRVVWFGKECNDVRSEIDINRVAHDCKEWASKHHYSVVSGWEMTHWGGAYRVDVYKNSSNILFSMSTIETESEAVFRACEWILEKVKENK